MAKMSTAVALLREKIQTTWGVRPAPAEALATVAGEIPRGVMTEIVGPATSGRTAALYSVLAAATAGQEFCALLDTDDRFDPLTAAAAGVRLSQLLWVRCGGSVEHALKAADMLANGGGFGMIAIDMADTPQAQVQRIPLAAWFRLRRGVENTRTALVSLAERTHAHPCSVLKVELRREKAAWSRYLQSPTAVGDLIRSHHRQPVRVHFQR